MSKNASGKKGVFIFMASSKNDSSWFDDNFEVTYDDDSTLRPSIDFDTTKSEKTSTKKTPKNAEKKKSKRNDSNKQAEKVIDLSIPTDISRAQERAQAKRYAQRPLPDYDADVASDYEDDDEYVPSSSGSGKSKRRKSGPTRLAAPLQKGGNVLYKVSKTFIRNLTLLLILAIIAILAYNFYYGSAPYGDLEDSLTTQNFSQTFLAYAAVALIILFSEVIALFWSMTKERIRDEFGVHWEDVGRGRNSFIVLYICSYAAFLLSDFLPESIDILKGIKGALAVFGSLHNQLFGLCVAGVVSCVIRKYRS